MRRVDAVLLEDGLDERDELHRELLAPQLVVGLDQERAEAPARVASVRRRVARGLCPRNPFNFAST
jgi:hypothetical protein